MRAFDPRKRSSKWRTDKRRSGSFASVFVAALIVGGAVSYFVKTGNISQPETNNDETLNQHLTAPAKKGTLKQFTGQQFKELYDSFSYPNTAPIDENTPITGDIPADIKIKSIAVSRGYKTRSAPVTNTFQDVGGGYTLQQKAALPWLDLKKAAQADGINLGLTAAYRSADEQKQIFLDRVRSTGIPVAAVGSGLYDLQISNILRTTAIPGYSRHHTGYTVDIACENEPRTSFMFTSCFQWLSANNYEKAKLHGWIPSYPEGAGQQGPDPESWEYVWVGKDALTD